MIPFDIIEFTADWLGVNIQGIMSFECNGRDNIVVCRYKHHDRGRVWSIRMVWLATHYEYTMIAIDDLVTELNSTLENYKVLMV